MPSFLILSDIHATDIDPSSSKAPSYVSSFNAAASASVDPISDLPRIIAEAGEEVNYILCAGDITNKSNPASFTYAWNRLHDLAKGISAKLVSTVGNHDIDSRYQANFFDPRGYAMSLVPALPLDDRLGFLEFWAQNFTVLQSSDVNIIILNTAAYHGGGKESDDEIEHGRVSDITLKAIGKAIADLPKRPTNVLLCHHHPIKSEASDPEEKGRTIGGDKLVGLLGKSNRPWVVVHGHKHVPDLFYAHGGANAPVILGSASFSAQVNADAQNKNPNQVHLLRTQPEAAKANGLTSAGTVRSWTWQPGVGWERARGSQGLPQVSGFGYRGSLDPLADQIDAALTALSQPQMAWSEAVLTAPSAAFLIPDDFESFRAALSERKLRILRDDEGALAQVGRSP